MKINLNGSLLELDAELSISEFVKLNNLDPEKIVFEYNGRVIKNKDWDTVILRDSDSALILSFVGGG